MFFKNTVIPLFLTKLVNIILTLLSKKPRVLLATARCLQKYKR
jgi:hypothetical protein